MTSPRQKTEKKSTRTRAEQKSFDFRVEPLNPKSKDEDVGSVKHGISQDKPTPMLSEIRPANDGGVVAVKGFEYQHYFAVAKCIEMAERPDEIEYISSETHEDVVVRFCSGIMEFNQVKTRTGKYWSISDLAKKGVWQSFLKARRAFGVNTQFRFVSNQSAKYGQSPNFDLAQMKDITYLQPGLCNERDLLIADVLIDRILELVSDDYQREEVESVFWNTQIQTDFEQMDGIRAKCLIALERLLLKRQSPADLPNRERVFGEIKNLIVKRLVSGQQQSYAEEISSRSITLDAIDECLRIPTIPHREIGQFQINDESDVKSLVEKTKDGGFPSHIQRFFMESRNYFAFRFYKEVTDPQSAQYIKRLRMKVWNACIQGQVQMVPQNGIAEYRHLIRKLEELAQQEVELEPVVAVDYDYLHGMLCQLTAECHHNWYKLDRMVS